MKAAIYGWVAGLRFYGEQFGSTLYMTKKKAKVWHEYWDAEKNGFDKAEDKLDANERAQLQRKRVTRMFPSAEMSGSEVEMDIFRRFFGEVVAFEHGALHKTERTTMKKYAQKWSDEVRKAIKEEVEVDVDDAIELQDVAVSLETAMMQDLDTTQTDLPNNEFADGDVSDEVTGWASSRWEIDAMASEDTWPGMIWRKAARPKEAADVWANGYPVFEPKDRIVPAIVNFMTPVNMEADAWPPEADHTHIWLELGGSEDDIAETSYIRGRNSVMEASQWVIRAGNALKNHPTFPNGTSRYVRRLYMVHSL